MSTTLLRTELRGDLRETVFTEFAVADFSVKCPLSESDAFDSSQGAPFV